MSDDRTIRVRLLAEVQSYLQGMKTAAGATVDFGKQVSGQGTATKKHMETIGRSALLMSAGITVALGASIKAAIDWESAWAGVTKTVNGSADEMGELEDGLRGLARSLPASHKEIAGVAEAAGQLGIQRSAIVGFTETMIALGVSTNLSSDQAATGIAQIANVMGTSQQDFDRFGSTLVALGNVGASTESEILEMAKRLSGAGALVGASESDVLALANAMASMGIEAQLGGGAFSRVMLKIFSAVKSGGDKLEGFAAVAGMTATEFAAAFEDDPIRAVDGLIRGLDDIDASGGNVIARLSELGIKGTQDLQVLLRLKGAGDLLTDSLELGSKAWLENTALTNEANKRYETTASRLKILRNQVVDVAIDTGGVFIPAIKGATDVLGTMVSGIGEIDGAQRTAVAGLGAIAAGATGIIGLLGVFGPKVALFKDSLMDMGSVGKFAGAHLGAIAGILGGLGAALAIYTYAVGRNAKIQAEADERTRGYTDAIIEQGGAVGETTDKLALEAIVAGDVGEALRDAESDLTIFTDALHTGNLAAEDVQDSLQLISGALRGGLGFDAMEDELNDSALAGSALVNELVRLGESGDITEEGMARFIDRLREEAAAWAQGTTEAKNKQAAEEGVAEATDKSSSASERAKRALDEQAKAAKEVTDGIKEMIDANHAALDPLFGMLDAAQGNRDAIRELNEAVKANSDGVKDNNVSVDEMARLHEAAAKSALDMDGAALSLAGAIAAGTVNLDIAKASLDTWVEQGLISKDTAIEMAKQFDAAAKKADTVAGTRVSEFLTSGLEDLNSKLDELLPKLQRVGLPINIQASITYPELFGPKGGGGPVTTKPSKSTGSSPRGGSLQAAGGWAGEGGWGGPRGTDTIPAWLSPGEFVLNKAAARNLGPSVLTGLNSGSMFTGRGDAPQRVTAAPQGQPVVVDFRHDTYLDGKKFMPTLKKQIRIEGGLQKALG